MTHKEFLAELLKDPEFREEYERTQPEADIIEAFLEARNKSRLTQKELSEKSGVAQADISKIESGKGNPTIKMLTRLALSMGYRVEIKLVPIKE